MALVFEWDFEQYQEEELLIALHTRFVPCKLAYWLNKELGIRLDYFLRITPFDERTDYISLLKEQYFIDHVYEIPLFPEGKTSYKEQRKLNEIKAKLIF